MVIEPEAARPRRKRTSKNQKQLAEARETAALLLSIVEMAAVERYGPVATMQATERALMEDPLGRVLARAPVERLERYAAIIDPLMIGAGLLMYASRLRASQPPRPAHEQSLKPTPETDPSIRPVLRQNLTPAGGPLG